MTGRRDGSDASIAPVRAVCFDVGETLIDETRVWGEWADWLAVPRLTFFGVLGALVARGEPHTRALEWFRPGFDLARERDLRRAAGQHEGLVADDLYPDVLPTLQALRDAGLFIGIAGNQPASVEATLRSWGLAVDLIATSDGWGLHKPNPAFFGRLVDEVGVLPEEIAYVGDRVDNDVIPAHDAGLMAILIRRGPWGHLHAEWPDAQLAAATIDSLAELPTLLHSV